MRLHRFIVNTDLSDSKVRLTDPDLISQMKNVLRLSVGDKVSLADGKGKEALAQVATLRKGIAELEVKKVYENYNESDKNVILYCSILKRENFELVIQKATEVGIKEIFPIVSERTVKLNIKMSRLGKIVKEAAEQSGRAFVPKLNEPIRFNDALDHAKRNNLNLFFDLSGKPIQYLIPTLKNHKTIGVFIGPEGGWSEKEVDSAKENKFEITSLGKLTLRSETAAIIISYLAALL